MLESLSQNQKITFFIMITIMLLFIIYFFYITFYKDTFYFENNSFLNDTNTLIQNNIEPVDFSSKDKSTIMVYICGAVQKETVITLTENSRIIDAIEAVGGLKDDADLSNINLAYILEDGEKIYIPKKGEQVSQENLISDNVSSINSNSTTSKEKININKAGQAELESIPGIGPSTALKIIEYRNQNGKFSSIEDIKNVAGIGDGKYEKMKEYIKVK